MSDGSKTYWGTIEVSGSSIPEYIQTAEYTINNTVFYDGIRITNGVPVFYDWNDARGSEMEYEIALVKDFYTKDECDSNFAEYNRLGDTVIVAETGETKEGYFFVDATNYQTGRCVPMFHDGSSTYTVLTDSTDYVSSSQVPYNIQSLSQSEYDALTTKDSNTLYFITE